MYARVIVALFKLIGNSEGPAAATPWHALNGYWRPVIGLSGRCLFLPPSLKTMQETEGFTQRRSGLGESAAAIALCPDLKVHYVRIGRHWTWC